MIRFDMKYIITRDMKTNQLEILIFSCETGHKAVANGILQEGKAPESAGFIEWDDDLGPCCIGNSVTLSLSSKKTRDTAMLRAFLHLELNETQQKIIEKLGKKWVTKDEDTSQS